MKQNNIHESVRVDKLPYSAFNLSHFVKGSYRFGKLYPVMTEEVLPGDHWRINHEVMCRMAPMTAPVMAEYDLYLHTFYIPNRILDDEWNKFWTGGEGTEKSVPDHVPSVELNTQTRAGKGTIVDYLGIPPHEVGSTNFPQISQLPIRAYHSIYNEYYRDENLIDPIDITDPQATEFWNIKPRAWAKDYFTSAQPQPQKGPAVPIPIDVSFSPQYENISQVRERSGQIPGADTGDTGVTYDQLGQLGFDVGVFASGRVENLVDPQILSGVNITIEDLRRASRLQQWLELAQRAGTRPKEALMSFYGVKSSDQRLDRPEYIMGTRQPLVISEVLSTVGEAEQTNFAPQGNMSGHGISVGNSGRSSYYVEEHGWIMTIMSVMPRAQYKQGIRKQFMRGVSQFQSTKFDFYWPQFANIGEQEVKNREIYWDWSGSQNEMDDPFGYQQKYAEYKYATSYVCGDFRDNLAFWTYTREFADQPKLSREFIQCNDDNLDSIFAVSEDLGGDYLWCQFHHELGVRRKMPYFSHPELG